MLNMSEETAPPPPPVSSTLRLVGGYMLLYALPLPRQLQQYTRSLQVTRQLQQLRLEHVVVVSRERNWDS
jgi:hypothetical protein